MSRAHGGPPRQPRRARPRRLRPRPVEVAAFVVVVAASLVGLSALGARLELRMEAAREASMRALSQQLGRTITYGSISPSVLRAIEVRDLRISSASGNGPPLLEVSRVRVGYSLIRLLATGDPALAVREIRLVNSHFVIDLQRDTEVLALLQDLTDLTGAQATPITLSGANIDLRLISDETVVDISRLFFRIKAGDELATTARGDVVLTTGGQAGGARQIYETSVRLDGTTQPSAGRTDANVRLRYVRGSVFQLAGQSLRISQRGDVLRLVKVQDRAPIDLSATVGLASGELDVQFQLDSFRPDRVLGVRGRWARGAAVLASTLSGGGTLRHTLGTDRFDYAFELDGSLVGLPYPPQMDLQTKASGNESRMDLAPLRITSDVGSLEFVGDILYRNLFPDGLVILTDIDTQTGNELDALLRVGRSLEGLQIRGDRVVLGVTGFRDFQLDLEPYGDPTFGAGEAGFEYRVQASVSQLASNSLRASGRIALRPTLALSVESELEDLPAARIYQLAVPRAARQQWLSRLTRAVTVGGSLSASTDFESLQFAADRLYAYASADPATRVELAAAGSDKAFRVEQLTGFLAGHSFSGAADLERAVGSATSVAADLVIDGLPYALEASVSSARLQVDGSYGLAIGVRQLGGDGGYAFDLASDGLPLPLFPDQPAVLATLDVSGRYRSSAQWSLQSQGSRFERLPAVLAADSAVAFALRADQRGAALTRLTYRDALSSLAGAGNLSYSSDLKKIQGALTLGGRESAERYDATLGRDGPQIDATINFALAPVERFAALPITGDLNGTLVVEGGLALPAVTVEVELVNGRLEADPISVSGGADIFDRLVSVRDFEVQLLTHRIRNGRLSYDLESGGLKAQADYSAEIFGDQVDASIQLVSFDADAGGKGLAGALARGATGDILVGDIRVDGETLPAWGGRIIAPAEPSPTAFRFSGGPDNAFTIAVSREGEFQMHSVAPYPVVAAAAGSIDGREIDATVTFESIDAAFANGILDTDMFTLTAGTGVGSVRIGGPVNDPDITGTLTLSNVAVASPITPSVLGPYSTVISLGEKQLEIAELQPEGDAVVPLTLSAIATVDHWEPRDFVVEIATIGAAAVPIRQSFGPVLFDGLASGALTISGGDGPIAISGAVKAGFARISLADQQEAGAADPLAVDIAVTIGRQVAFSWPSQQFPIVRALITPEETLVVRYDGPNGTYAVEGELAVRGGDVIYFDRSFILREGSITFREDELQFDPFLRVVAETRERDINGEDVRILLTAETPLSEFSPQNVSFTADPPTHELAIEALLGSPLTARLAADQNGGLASTAISLSGDLLAQFGLIRPLEQAVREILGLDLVSIRSPFVQNLLLDRVLSPVAGTAADLLDNTTLSLGRYIGSDLFLEALLRLQTPSGIASGLPGSGLESDLELSLEWATPFFLLEWSFLPQSEETLYLTDNSLSLRWRLTY